MNRINPKELADIRLQPLIDRAAEIRGFPTVLAGKLSEMTGQKISRGQVQRWLARDPAKRVEPKLGIGLVLLMIGKELKAI